jgi:hypothetical protein
MVKKLAVVALGLLGVASLTFALSLLARPRVGGDFGICLPDRYFITSESAEFQTLSRRDATHRTIYDRILSGTITRWGETEGIVTGVLETEVFKDPFWADLATERSLPGYFILNTRTQEVRSGLSEAQYLDQLRELGVTPPLLHRLSPFQQYSFRCIFGDSK